MPLYYPPPATTTVLTTKGDLLAHNGSILVRMPAGSDGKLLGADSSQTNGLGYGFASPVYSLSGVNADRTIDVDATTLNEALNVLGTLIQDLQTRGVVA